MATTAALDLITDALGVVGVASPGQPLSAADLALGLRQLNRLIDSWSASAGYAWAQRHVSVRTVGTVSRLTVGPGQQLDTDRPVRLAGGFVRRSGFDFPFRMVDRADYDASYKGPCGIAPGVAWYDGAGTIHFAPAFSGSGAEVFIPVEAGLARFSAATSAQELPQGYADALVLTLAEQLAPHYQRQLLPATVREAVNARRRLRRANLTIPTLDTGCVRASPLWAGTEGSFTGIENGRFPRSGVGVASAWQVASVKALFDSMAPIAGSESGGKRGGPFTVRPGGDQYGWVAVPRPAAEGGVMFTGTFGPGGWSGAGLAGNNTGPSPSVSTASVAYADATGEYLLFRQDFAGAEFTGYIS